MKLIYEHLKIYKIWSGAVNAITKCDTLIVAGTSLTVYPASSLLHYYRGSNLVLINKSKTPFDNMANLVINDSLGKVFSEI